MLVLNVRGLSALMRRDLSSGGSFLLRASLVALDHFLNHLAADAACLLRCQVAVITAFKADTHIGRSFHFKTIHGIFRRRGGFLGAAGAIFASLTGFFGASHVILSLLQLDSAPSVHAKTKNLCFRNDRPFGAFLLCTELHRLCYQHFTCFGGLRNSGKPVHAILLRNEGVYEGNALRAVVDGDISKAV